MVEDQEYVPNTARSLEFGNCCTLASPNGRDSAHAIGNGMLRQIQIHGRCYPRPTYGMLVAITVMDSTLVESGRLAM